MGGEWNIKRHYISRIIPIGCTFGVIPFKIKNHIQCWQPVSCSYYKQEIVQVDKSNVPGQKSCFVNIEI
jgi:hypothetical protein